MELIRAALCNERDLSSGAAALIGSFATDGDTEFLHGIEGHGQSCIESHSSVLSVTVQARKGQQTIASQHVQPRVLIVIRVHAVEDDVVLIAARSQHLSGLGNPGLQAQ